MHVIFAELCSSKIKKQRVEDYVLDAHTLSAMVVLTKKQDRLRNPRNNSNNAWFARINATAKNVRKKGAEIKDLTISLHQNPPSLDPTISKVQLKT